MRLSRYATPPLTSPRLSSSQHTLLQNVAEAPRAKETNLGRSHWDPNAETDAAAGEDIGIPPIKSQVSESSYVLNKLLKRRTFSFLYFDQKFFNQYEKDYGKDVSSSLVFFLRQLASHPQRLKKKGHHSHHMLNFRRFLLACDRKCVASSTR